MAGLANIEVLIGNCYSKFKIEFMKTSKLILSGFLQALGTAVYIVMVAAIMRNSERIFGKEDNFFSPIAFLLLFVLSAAVTGTLTLGRPILWYLDGRKAEGVKLFLFTLGWLFIMTLIAFCTLVCLK